MKTPLADVKVVDFSQVLTGPYCSMMLAEMGAEVIKIEQPGKGDETRTWPPMVQDESGYFFCLNRSKKSLTVNMKSEKGREIIYKLVRKADVVLENFTPGVTKRLGIDYDTLKEINPRLIYCSISGYGQTGPDSHKKGYDPVFQAIGGIMSITGEKDGPPVKVGAPITDVVSGVYAATGIMTALYAREKTGKGQYIDISMFENTISLLTFMGAIYLCTGEVPTRYGSEHPTRVPTANYKCQDGVYIHIVVNDRQWPKFCEAIGRADLIEDQSIALNYQRVQQRDRVNQIIQEQLLTKTADEWFNIFEEYDIPAGPINTIDKVFEHRQVKAREVIQTFHHPKVGEVKGVRIPFRFSDLEVGIKSRPPLLGEHNDEILKSLGLSDEEIEKLKKEGIV